MSRIKLDLPAATHFTTDIPVRITDINYGGHLGNDALLSLIHEARVRFLRRYGYSELDIEGRSIIMSDVAIVYKAEAFHGNILEFAVSAVDFHRFGCDLFYRITHKDSGKEVARAKTGIVFYDYPAKKLVSVPATFQQLFTP
ncbi:MAG: thioesterase family protein [Bacteroidetes bacterium]|nr:thioesterase family protein [Bacteroidota bacterium]MCW5895942.1 thioesterase family protein [Bacteroidota bacterium]